MRALSWLRIASCLFTLAPGLAALADTPMPAKKKPATAGEASSEYIIGTAERLNQGDNADELKQLITQLNAMKGQRSALVTQRNGKEAQLQSARASGNTVLAGKLEAELTTLRNMIDSRDAQIAQLTARIQSLQARRNGEAQAPVVVTEAVKPRPVNVPKAAKAAGAVPPDRLKAAATTLSQSAVPSAGAARAAALNLLATHQPGYTNADVEQLALVVMQQASREADADLREQMAEMKRQNAGKEAVRRAVDKAKEGKDSGIELAAENAAKTVRHYQERSDRFHRILSEMMKQASDTSSQITGNLK